MSGLPSAAWPLVIGSAALVVAFAIVAVRRASRSITQRPHPDGRNNQMTTPRVEIAADDVSQVVSYFVRSWEAALGDPNSRRTEPSAANLIVSLDVEVREWLSRQVKTMFLKNGDGLHSRLADLLDKALQLRDPNVELLIRLKPAEMATVQALISPATIDGQALVVSLAPLVSMVASPMPNIADLLVDVWPQLGADLTASGSFESDALDSAATLGARALLIHDRPDALKKGLKYWLSAGSARVILAECGPSLVADQVLAQKAETAFREVISRLGMVDIEKRSGEQLDWPPRYYELWRASSALVDARADIDGALQSYATHLAMNFGSRAVRLPLLAFIGPAEGSVRAVWDAMSDLSAVLGDWFAGRGWIRQQNGYRPWGGVLSDACRTEVARAIVAPVVPIVLSQSGEAMGSLRAWLEAGLANTRTADDQQRLWYLANRAVQDGMAQFTSAIQSTMIAAIMSRIQALAGDGDTDGSGSFTCAAVLGALGNCCASSEDAWQWVQWGRFSGPQLAQSLDSARAAFATSRDYDVVIPITGASIEPTSWRSGLLTWYTPKTHSLGEDLLTGADEGRNANLHVWLRVAATGVEAAHERAQVVLEPALSALTFALSSGQDMSGFRPGTDVWFAYGQVAEGYGGWHGSRHRTESADRLVSAKDLQDFSVAYAPLIARAAGPGPQTEFEIGLLRALFWYRSGRWQRNPARRFLDHFVALEHLFATGARNKDKAVADGVGALEGCWIHRGFPFSAHLRHTIDVARQLRSVATADTTIGDAAQRVADEGRSGCTNAIHWRTHLSPWLSPSFVREVSTLVSLQPLPPLWLSHAAALASLQANESNWTMIDKERSDRAWFKIRLLAQRRHDIVHQALTYVAGIEYEAASLTEVIETVLRHLVEDALTRPAAAGTMQDVLNDLAAPWLC